MCQKLESIIEVFPISPISHINLVEAGPMTERPEVQSSY